MKVGAGFLLPVIPETIISPMSIHSDSISVDADFDAFDNSYTNYHTPGRDARIPGERNLWCAVIHQALDDLGVEDERAEAERWLLHSNKDFLLVCALAGISPAAVRQAAVKKMHGARPAH
jgi:hypothetical protein